MQPPGHIHVSCVVFRQVCASNRLHYTYYSERAMAHRATEPGSSGNYPPTNLVSTWPHLFCRGFANHGNRRFFIDFFTSKCTSSKQSNADGIKVFVRYAVEYTTKRGTLLVLKSAGASSKERYSICPGHGNNCWYRFDPLQCLAQHVYANARGLCGALSIDSDNRQVFIVESRVDVFRAKGSSEQ